MCRGFSATLILPILLCLAGLSARRQDEIADLEHITAALKEWQSSIDTLRLRCEIKFDSGSKRMKEEGLAGAQFTRIVDWAYTANGKRRIHETTFRDGKVYHRSLFGTDGNQRWSLTYSQGESSEGKPESASFTPLSGNFSTSVITPLFGIWSESHDRWLGSVLEQGGGTLGKGKIIEGVHLQEVNIDSGPDARLTLFLDPRHAFLPRTALFGNPAAGAFLQEVTEFHELDAGMWFPWAGRFSVMEKGRALDTKEWQIQELTLNQSFPDDLFRPAIPAGTRVTDGIKGTTYYEGAVEARREVEAGLVDRAKANLAGRPVSAVPPESRWVVWLSGGAAAIALLLLLIAWRMHKTTG